VVDAPLKVDKPAGWILDMADMISSGIIKQFPARFL
jgi:hypothetical protein